MTYEEYRKDLTDQIGNKRAKKLVMQEIDNHIEELTSQFEREGMNHATAVEHAIAEMGNPSETGMELNKIHRPRFPYILFAMAVILSIFGVLLQSKIIPILENERMNNHGLSHAILYSVIGLAITLVIVFFDYTVIVKHAYKIWIGYLAMIAVAPFITGLPFLQNTIMLISVLAALFPILFAALLYRQRGREWKGILKCMAILLTTSVFIIIFGYFYSTGFLAETILICLFMMAVAILKGIMGRHKKTMLALVTLPPFAVIGAFVCRIVPLNTIQTIRIDAFLHPGKYINDTNFTYITIMLKRLTQFFSMGGSRSFEKQMNFLSSMQIHTDYTVFSMFIWFGVVIGSMILALLFAFCVYSLWISLKQSNRISFLFGTMCSVALLVRSLFYVLDNFGLFISYATYFPFLKYGLGNAVVNGCYIGIIMCVYRNSNILGENIKYIGKSIRTE